MKPSVWSAVYRVINAITQPLDRGSELRKGSWLWLDEHKVFEFPQKISYKISYKTTKGMPEVCTTAPLTNDLAAINCKDEEARRKNLSPSHRRKIKKKEYINIHAAFIWIKNRYSQFLTGRCTINTKWNKPTASKLFFLTLKQIKLTKWNEKFPLSHKCKRYFFTRLIEREIGEGTSQYDQEAASVPCTGPP